MNLKLLLGILTVSLGLLSCASTMRFDQTCITCVNSQRLSCEDGNCPKTFMLGNNCLVTIIETGENLYLNPIFEKEGLAPSAGVPIAIAKLNGLYYLTGDNFKKLWIICPKKNNEAKIKSIDLPLKNQKIDSPVFSIDYTETLLKFTAGNYNNSTYLLRNNEWVLIGGGKAGE